MRFHSAAVRPKLRMARLSRGDNPEGHMQNRPLHEFPMRELNRPAPKVEVRDGLNGVIYVSCGLKYEPGLPSLIDYLARAAELRPDTTFLAERDANKQWRRLSYAAA